MSERVTHRLLQHHDLLDDPSVLNLFYVMGIDGALDCDALYLAFASLIETYPILGHSPWDAWKFLDLSREDEATAGETLATLINAERLTPFDPSAGSLARAKLVHAGPRRHILTIAFHHAAADGWSLALYARHLSQAYDNYRQGKPHPPPKPPPSPSIISSVRTPRSERDRRELAAVLEGLPARAIDPFDQPATFDSTRRVHSRTLAGNFADRLQQYATRHRTTVFALLATAAAQEASVMFEVRKLVLGTIVLGRRSAAELEAPGANFDGSLIVLPDGDFSLSRVNAAVAATVGRHLDYEEQCAVLREKVPSAVTAEPALFLVADTHPMGGFRLPGTEISVVGKPPADLATLAHSPACGRLALTWRRAGLGEPGQPAAVSVFSAAELEETSKEMLDGVVSHLSRWADMAPQAVDPIIWHGGLVRYPAPTFEALSPVTLPNHSHPIVRTI